MGVLVTVLYVTELEWLLKKLTQLKASASESEAMFLADRLAHFTIMLPTSKSTGDLSEDFTRVVSVLPSELSLIIEEYQLLLKTLEQRELSIAILHTEKRLATLSALLDTPTPVNYPTSLKTR